MEPPKRRRTQEDRSREARERFLQAAVDTLFDRGFNGFTTKEVAGRAGFSVGALMHHYPTKAELAVAATAFIYEQAIARGQRSAAEPAAIEDPLGGFVRDSLTVYRDWPFMAALEVIVTARTDPALMDRIVPVMQRYRRITDETWIGVFRSAGYAADAAERVLKLVLTLIRGMAVNSLWQQDSAIAWAHLESWVALSARALLGEYAPATAGTENRPANVRVPATNSNEQGRKDGQEEECGAGVGADRRVGRIGTRR